MDWKVKKQRINISNIKVVWERGKWRVSLERMVDNKEKRVNLSNALGENLEWVCY